MLLPVGTKVIVREGTQFKGQDSYFDDFPIVQNSSYSGNKKQGYGIIYQYINIEDFCYSVRWYKQNGEQYASNNYRKKDLQVFSFNNEDTLIRLKSDKDASIGGI